MLRYPRTDIHTHEFSHYTTKMSIGVVDKPEELRGFFVGHAGFCRIMFVGMIYSTEFSVFDAEFSFAGSKS